MPRTRKTHSAELKAKVALEALPGQRTTAEIAQMYAVHPNLVAALAAACHRLAARLVRR